MVPTPEIGKIHVNICVHIVSYIGNISLHIHGNKLSKVICFMLSDNKLEGNRHFSGTSYMQNLNKLKFLVIPT